MAVQLDIFTKRKARRQRLASEFEVHCLLADTLKLSISPGWIWWHTPNGGQRNLGEAGRFKRMGVRAGILDFLFVAPPLGQLHALELKQGYGKPTEEQARFLEAVVAAGGKSAWVTGFDEAIEVLRGWGAVRIRL